MAMRLSLELFDFSCWRALHIRTSAQAAAASEAVHKKAVVKLFRGSTVLNRDRSNGDY